MNDFNLSNTTPKVHKHVLVYNKLYSLIKDGTFPIDSQLPSEPELAAMMDVSRMTLRRALAPLQDDGLLILVRGKGNFVKSNDAKSFLNTRRLNTIQHPFYACSVDDINDLELEFRIELPTDSILESINRQTAAIVIVDRWYKKMMIPVGYTLSLVPIETISKNQIDLTVTKQLEDFIEKGIYDKCVRSSSTFAHTTTGNFSAAKYKIADKNSFILIQETLYDKDDNLIIYNKHYIPLERFRVQIALTQEIDEG